jgi:hypothetical protein
VLRRLLSTEPDQEAWPHRQCLLLCNSATAAGEPFSPGVFSTPCNPELYDSQKQGHRGTWSQSGTKPLCLFNLGPRPPGILPTEMRRLLLASWAPASLLQPFSSLVLPYYHSLGTMPYFIAGTFPL